MYKQLTHLHKQLFDPLVQVTDWLVQVTIWPTYMITSCDCLTHLCDYHKQLFDPLVWPTSTDNLMHLYECLKWRSDPLVWPYLNWQLDAFVQVSEVTIWSTCMILSQATVWLACLRSSTLSQILIHCLKRSVVWMTICKRIWHLCMSCLRVFITVTVSPFPLLLHTLENCTFQQLTYGLTVNSIYPIANMVWYSPYKKWSRFFFHTMT